MGGRIMTKFSIGVLAGLFFLAFTYRVAIEPYFENVSPGNTKREMDLAVYYSKNGRWAAAMQHVNNALVKFNGDVTAWGACFLAGEISFHTGYLPRAREFYEEALRLCPDFSPAREALKRLEEAEKLKQICIKTKETPKNERNRKDIQRPSSGHRRP